MASKLRLFTKRLFIYTNLVLVFFFLLALGIYYKVYTFLIEFTHSIETERGKLGNNLSGYADKLRWFGSILTEASRMHLLLFKANKIRLLFTGIFIIILIRDLIRMKFMDLFFLLVFSMLLFLPHFLISVNWGASRNFVLISLIMFSYMALRLTQWMPKMNSPWLWLFIVPFTGILYLNVFTAWVVPQQKEYNCLKTFSEGLPLIKGGDSIRVSVISPAWDLHSGKSRLNFYKDEFNVPVCLHYWPVAPAVRVFYQDKNPQFSAEDIRKAIKVQVVTHDSAFASQADAIRLDMNSAIH
ncbi:MAG: hypothetical protein ACHQRM_16655 [Bacteroidia bacterium]